MNSILVDTSVWVSHFRKANPTLLMLLESDLVVTHPLIRGEIACGTPPDRVRTLADMAALRTIAQATIEETVQFIDRHALYGKGAGFIDLQLLTSTLLEAGALLWTEDKKLRDLATRFSLSYYPAM